MDILHFSQSMLYSIRKPSPDCIHYDPNTYSEWYGNNWWWHNEYKIRTDGNIQQIWGQIEKMRNWADWYYLMENKLLWPIHGYWTIHYRDLSLIMILLAGTHCNWDGYYRCHTDQHQIQTYNNQWWQWSKLNEINEDSLKVLNLNLPRTQKFYMVQILLIRWLSSE